MALRIVCPGKIMLAGEYAVVDGGPALMIAVQAHAVATLEQHAQALSPFLAQVHRTLVEELGVQSPEARAALLVRVDTSAFRQGETKLGLGSSAAATVAAMAAALAADGQEVSPARVYPLAARAHAEAQAAMGARGSGADVAACAFGGCLRFQHGDPAPQVRPISLPPDLHLRFAWTGVAASTPALVAQVQRFRASQAGAYAELETRISAGAEALAAAASAAETLQAIAAGGAALRALGEAAGVPLWLPVHEELAKLAQRHGGSLKPTGAGGGDLALAAFATAEGAEGFENGLLDLGIPCPRLDVDSQGVRLQV
jgi:phosphomevalonate kinase